MTCHFSWWFISPLFHSPQSADWQGNGIYISKLDSHLLINFQTASRADSQFTVVVPVHSVYLHNHFKVTLSIKAVSSRYLPPLLNYIHSHDYNNKQHPLTFVPPYHILFSLLTTNGPIEVGVDLSKNYFHPAFCSCKLSSKQFNLPPAFLRSWIFRAQRQAYSSLSKRLQSATAFHCHL